MKWKEYKEAVKVTLADLGSKEENNKHMIAGMAGELGEIIQAVRKKDIVNLGEELSDVSWFGTSWGNINNLLIHSGDGISNIDNLDSFKPITFWDKISNIGYRLLVNSNLKYPLLYNHEFENLQIIISEINDLEKREFAYKKLQNDVDRKRLLYQLLECLSWCYFFAGIDAEDSLQKNIDKLMVRYHKKKFEAEQANNRDLSAERLVLEGK